MVLDILLGLIIGMAVCWFVFAPAKIQSANNTANQQVIEYSDQLEAKNATINSITEELNSEKAARTTAEAQVEAAEAKAAAYDALFEAQKLEAENNLEAAAEALTKVDPENLAEGAKEIYENVNASVNATVIEDLYKTGEASYNAGKYEEAKTDLEKVVSLNPQHDYAVYYLARSCEKLNDTENAKKYYQMVVDLLPAGTQRAQTAKAYLDANP